MRTHESYHTKIKGISAQIELLKRSTQEADLVLALIEERIENLINEACLTIDNNGEVKKIRAYNYFKLDQLIYELNQLTVQDLFDYVIGQLNFKYGIRLNGETLPIAFKINDEFFRDIITKAKNIYSSEKQDPAEIKIIDIGCGNNPKDLYLERGLIKDIRTFLDISDKTRVSITGIDIFDSQARFQDGNTTFQYIPCRCENAAKQLGQFDAALLIHPSPKNINLEFFAHTIQTLRNDFVVLLTTDIPEEDIILPKDLNIVRPIEMKHQDYYGGAQFSVVCQGNKNNHKGIRTSRIQMGRINRLIKTNEPAYKIDKQEKNNRLTAAKNSISEFCSRIEADAIIKVIVNEIENFVFLAVSSVEIDFLNPHAMSNYIWKKLDLLLDKEPEKRQTVVNVAIEKAKEMNIKEETILELIKEATRNIFDLTVEMERDLYE